MLSTRLAIHPNGTTAWKITNDDQEIVDTDYWDSLPAKTGVYFMNGNAGALRLLIPDRIRVHAGTPAFPMFRMVPNAEVIAEMRTGKRVVLEPSISMPGSHIDVVFNDGTKRPFSITLTDAQSSNISWDGSEIPFTVWTREGCVMRSTVTRDPRLSDNGAA